MRFGRENYLQEINMPPRSKNFKSRVRDKTRPTELNGVTVLCKVQKGKPIHRRDAEHTETKQREERLCCEWALFDHPLSSRNDLECFGSIKCIPISNNYTLLTRHGARIDFQNRPDFRATHLSNVRSYAISKIHRS